MAHEVFISYSSKDKEIADSICFTMERSGLKCWIAPRDVQPGNKYAKEIVTAIQECFVMLLVFSESSNKSEHIENEIDIAFNEGKTIIPFKITETQMSSELKYYLNKKHWIDGVPEPEKCFEKLVEQVSLSIPHRSKEIKENELFQRLENILDDYKQKGINFSNEKLISFNKKLENFLKEGKIKDDQEFEKLMDDFINSELKNKNEISCPDKEQIGEERGNDPDDEEHGRYDIIQNGAGELLIIIKSKKSEPDNPRIVYDGGSYAMLYRNKESSVMLTNISEEARPAIRAVDEVLMVEVKDDDVVREYNVPVRNVKSLDHLLKLNP